MRTFLILAASVLVSLATGVAAAPITVTLDTGGYHLNPGFGCGRDPGDETLCVTATSHRVGRTRFALDDGESRTLTFGVLRLQEDDGEVTYGEREALQLGVFLWITGPVVERVTNRVRGIVASGPLGDADVDLRFDFDPLTLSVAGGGTLTVAFGDLAFTDNRQAQRHTVTVTYNAATPIPEPSTLLLLGTTLFGLHAVRRRRSREPRREWPGRALRDA